MKISIRFARPGEVKEIVKLINEENARSEAVMKVTEEGIRKWVNNKHSLVAISEGRIIGHQALNFWPECGWMELRSAVVDKTHRGKGIGYKMTKILIDTAIRQKPEMTVIGIKNKTERGNGILLSLGFEEIKLEEVPAELFTIRSKSERKAFVAKFGKSVVS